MYGSPERKNQHIKRFILLVYMILEAGKSHNLLSANWRPRKASGVVRRPESWTAGTRGSSLGLKA